MKKLAVIVVSLLLCSVLLNYVSRYWDFSWITGSDIGDIYLNQTSLDCIGCHGGVKEVEAQEIETPWTTIKWGGYKTKMNYLQPHKDVKNLESKLIGVAHAADFSGTGNHPIGVVGQLSERGVCREPVFPNGYVQCESCHKQNKPNPGQGHMAVRCESNKGSKLCLACHDK